MALKTKIDDLLKIAAGKGLWDGLLGDREIWLVVGAAAFLARRFLKGPKPVSLVEKLGPGERLIVEHLGITERQRRKT